MHSSPACPDNCPGCGHRHLTARQSREQKQLWLMQKLAGWTDCIQSIQAVPAGEDLGYRDKVCLSARWENEQWHIGLLHHDEVIPIPDCPVHSPRVRNAMACLAPALPQASEFPMAYYAQSGAQITLVLKTREMPAMQWLLPDLIDQLKKIGVEGLWIHRHPSAGRRVFAKNGWDLVWGTPRSVDNNGVLYGPTAFQQLIPGLFAQALCAAEAFFTPTRKDLIFDLYSGIGASLSRWSEKSSRVLGVELSGESIECAVYNAPAAVIYRGTCKHRLPQLTEAINEAHNKRYIFANPPRTGLEQKTREWIGSVCRPDKLAYLSCSAGTLNRDLTALENAGYGIDRIIPYDFFPKTHHVETLALISRKNQT
ncbi:MAG: hypothetical protein U5L07_18910 [Desulfobacterales bacterium]|nr:hypothetical protein [Desulfobacterales bacterium]